MSAQLLVDRLRNATNRKDLIAGTALRALAGAFLVGTNAGAFFGPSNEQKFLGAC